MRILSREMVQHAHEASGHYRDICFIERQLHRSCKQFQTFQLGRRCMMPTNCTNLDALMQGWIDIPPRALLMYLRGYAQQLLRRS
jgi:hypothetical protein